MNAQEAIEVVNKDVECREYVLGKDKDAHTQALSIVLESARLFHGKALPEMMKNNLRFGRTEEYRTIYGIPLEKLGIDLDKVEGAKE